MQAASMWLRLARLLRLVRVVQSIDALRSLMLTLVGALPSLGSVISLMFLFLFIYALLGVQLFHDVVHGEYLNDDYNFKSVPSAMITLLSSATGESWNGIMHDLAVEPNGTDWVVRATGGVPRMPVCGLTDEMGTNDCGSWIAYPFFITFELIMFCLLINAAVAVLLGHFVEEEQNSFLGPERYEQFAIEWSKLDPLAAHRIQATELSLLLKRLLPPLGVKQSRKKFALYKCLASLSDPSNPFKLQLHKGGFLAFHEVLMGLSARHFRSARQGLGSTRFAKQHNAAVRRQMAKSLAFALGHSHARLIGSLWAPSKHSPSLSSVPAKGAPAAANDATVLDIYATQRLQAAFVGLKARRLRKQGRLGREQSGSGVAERGGTGSNTASNAKLAPPKLAVSGILRDIDPPQPQPVQV